MGRDLLNLLLWGDTRATCECDMLSGHRNGVILFFAFLSPTPWGPRLVGPVPFPMDPCVKGHDLEPVDRALGLALVGFDQAVEVDGPVGQPPGEVEPPPSFGGLIV